MDLFNRDDPGELLRESCSGGTYMIFLKPFGWGMTLARSSDSSTTGKIEMMLKKTDAIAILKEHCFELHSHYCMGLGGQVEDVWIANRDRQRAKKEAELAKKKTRR